MRIEPAIKSVSMFEKLTKVGGVVKFNPGSVVIWGGTLFEGGGYISRIAGDELLVSFLESPDSVRYTSFIDVERLFFDTYSLEIENSWGIRSHLLTCG